MATLIGTPVSFDLGQTTTPGAQTLTVPSDATHVVIFFALSDSADTPDAVVSSLSSTFGGTFSINNSVATAVSIGASVCYATVTSTGAGKTFTPVFSNASTVGAVVAHVSFFKDIPSWPPNVGFAHATTPGTVAATASVAGTIGGLSVAFDAKLSTTSANYPANESGYTSQLTAQSGPGALAYYTCARLRTKAITSTGTESATTQAAVLVSVVALVTLGPTTLTIGLAGVSVTAARGTVSTSVAKTLIGAAVTTARGSVAQGATIGLTGKVVSTSQGTIGYSTASGLTIALTGEAVSATPGALGTEISRVLVGEAVTSVTGLLTTGISRALVGAQIPAAHGLLSYQAAWPSIGRTASLSKSDIAYAPSYALSGTSSGVSQGSINYITGSVLNIALSGISVTTAQGSVAAQAGYALIGLKAQTAAGTLQFPSQVTASVYSGGWPQDHHAPSKEERKKQRQRLGILPQDEPIPVVVEQAAEPLAPKTSPKAIEIKSPALSPESVQRLSADLAQRILAGPLPKDFLGGTMPLEVPTVLITAPKGMPEADLAFIAASLLMH